MDQFSKDEEILFYPSSRGQHQSNHDPLNQTQTFLPRDHQLRASSKDASSVSVKKTTIE
jgi:hypothetical protein